MGLGTCARSLFLVLFLPMFLFHCVVLFSRKLSEYFFFLASCFAERLGANFGYLAFVLVRCILLLFLPMFLFYDVVLFSRKLS